MHRFSKRVWLFSAVLAIAAMVAPAISFAGPKLQDPKLNLSHIECTDAGVLVHFVLLFWGDVQPPTLSGTYFDGTSVKPFGPVETYKTSGNVWHYEVILPSGYIDIRSANVASVALHNPGEYAGDYQCEESRECPIPDGVQNDTLLCTDKPLTNPGDECAEFGLVPLGKGDNLTGLTFVATRDARLALVKSGGRDVCGAGNSSYRIYVDVQAGQTLNAPGTQNISHVTYCGCPEQ